MSLTSRPSRLERIRQRLSGKVPLRSSSGSAAEPWRIHSTDSGYTKDVEIIPAKVLSLPSPESSPSSRMSSDSTLNPTRTKEAYEILINALKTLDAGQRETIQALISPDSVTINAVLDEVYNHAGDLQKRSAMKGWTWNYNGRQVNLRDQSDKLLRFLERFKSWGNAVANIDPILVGLPWAGVRTILEVCIPQRTG